MRSSLADSLATARTLFIKLEELQYAVAAVVVGAVVLVVACGLYCCMCCCGLCCYMVVVGLSVFDFIVSAYVFAHRFMQSFSHGPQHMEADESKQRELTMRLTMTTRTLARMWARRR